MRFLIVLAVVAVATATVVEKDVWDVVLGKETLTTMDFKTKEMCLLKLLNHIRQPTVYTDIREIAREWNIEGNLDKYLKVDVVKKFIEHFRMGMLPRGEVFVHTNEKHMREAVNVFRMLYFAKDFDVFIRTACWMRERINPGMFVYALTVAVYHRTDCRGITLPAPYEITPHFFVDQHVIDKAVMMKMTKGITDPVVADYYGVKVTDKNLVLIDWRKGVRASLTKNDRINYFTEDIDLNTYMLNLHLNYPYWMTDEVYGVHKERRGEIVSYAYQQLLARLRLERLTHEMCDVKPIVLHDIVKEGYWPKLRLYNGWEMPMRSNNVKILTKENIKEKMLIDDLERIIRDGILKGKIELRDGTMINLKKAEDVEYLARLVLGGLNIVHDDAKLIHLVTLFKKMFSYNVHNMHMNTYIPTAMDTYMTCLRDPAFWRILKRINDYFVLFKKMLPVYTREDLDFPGVKVEKIVTDKLVTFMDEYDVDITNAVLLDETEMKKKHADKVFVGRMRRLNNHPFKVSIDVVSDKAVDAVVRVFLGPKYDCMGRLIKLNDKRHDMVEIDSFIYKLDTGKNVIVRDSKDMHNILDDRMWTRNIWDKTFEVTGTLNIGDRMVDSYWYKSRIGFPRRLLLPMGRRGGFEMQMFVIVTPVRNGLTLPTVDINIMKERRSCYWTTCVDTMPLGFPFDREIDVTHFFTNNMKFTDVMIFRKDMDISNTVKEIDMADMVMKRDDLTYLDKDMLIRWTYKDVMMMSHDSMMRM